jgi:hypothetical protein
MTRVAHKPLVLNTNPIRAKDFVSLGSMFAPGVMFVVALAVAHAFDGRFAWLATPVRYPWEFWVLAACGTVATAGGLGDWLFHRTYVAVGPHEHRAHVLALASGGLPLFFLMAAASVLASPLVLLVPVLVVVLYMTALICFDEFAFHRHRCTPLETLLHRLLVFGNGVAWLAWTHWCFVRGGAGGA